MNYFRVTKYNPMYRDCNGNYTLNEWTSISDVGKIFDGKEFTFSSYKFYEDAYVNTIILLLKKNNSSFLKIYELEKHGLDSYPDFVNTNAEDYYNNACSGQLVYFRDINIFARLILREIIWCKLLSDNVFIHFGYDYYMYIGSRKNLNAELADINKSGLFAENMVSPYI